ncbi:MAG: cyclase family protein [Planctomycetes bacterium]|nr:cyclase family protein [Planctomycetota bacterium]MCH8964884.1 cyclase family protein [Planctomycetota bacterium]
MIYDISPPITDSIAVFPGDTPPTREMLMDMRKGDALTLSTLRSTVHVGAHADAPSHYGAEAPTIDQVDLQRYVGPCQVVRVAASRGALLTPDAINAEITESRVLFVTGTYPNPNTFNTDFAALSPELIDWLAELGVNLVGVDTPSVDPADSKDLPAHKAFLKNDVYILEGLVLSEVPEGQYELIALPLKLVGFDASPVRAVLKTQD